MPQYRVLHDFGSHLGNHYRGEYLNLPEGGLPRGFAGFVEHVSEPPKPVVLDTKDIKPAAEGTAAAGPVPPAVAERPGAETPATSPVDQHQAGYSDKMVRPAANTGHGHVTPRPDGVKARCGGPGICSACSKEAALRPKADRGQR